MAPDPIVFNSREQAYTPSSAGGVVKSYIEAYIVYSGIIKSRAKLKFKDFLGNTVQDVEKLIDHDQFFLDRERALKHVECMSDAQGLLRVFIPESAVEAQPGALALKSDAIRLEYIHGYYPGWAKGQIYYKNPDFEDNILKQIKLIAFEEMV